MTPFFVFSIPNGEKRNSRTGLAKVVEGLVAGMPDLQIVELVLFIEMKAKGGTVEPKQKKIHERLRQAGATVEVCYSTQQAIDVVTLAMASRGMVPTRQPLKKVVTR
jgi:hypothetical protein